MPNEHISETYQIVLENTSKDPKRIKSSINDTVYISKFSLALKIRKSLKSYSKYDVEGVRYPENDDAMTSYILSYGVSAS